VVLVDDTLVRLIRTRETFDGMLARDIFSSPPPQQPGAVPSRALASQRSSP